MYLINKYENGKFTKVGTTSDLTYTITDLENGKEYGYAVRARIGGKWIAVEQTDVVYATSENGKSDPTKPVVTAIPGNGQITLTWTPVEGSDMYLINRYENDKFVKVGTTSDLTYTITGLENGKNYCYVVRARINGKWVTATTNDVVYVIVG